MIEAGKSYTFHLNDADGWSQSTLKVLAREGDLVTLSRYGSPAFILNLASSGFHKAEPSDRDADADTIEKVNIVLVDPISGAQTPLDWP